MGKDSKGRNREGKIQTRVPRDRGRCGDRGETNVVGCGYRW